jgi:hypothetical protein
LVCDSTPLPFDGSASSKSSHSRLGGLQFSTLSNVPFPSPIAIDVISPLPSPITLEPSGHFRVFISLIQIFKLLHPLMQESLCVPSFVQPSFNGNTHVDSLATSFENMVILNDLLNTKSNLHLQHVHPP